MVSTHRPTSQTRSTGAHPQAGCIDVHLLDTYAALVSDAIVECVEPGINVEPLSRALRSRVAFASIDAFFQHRLNEALRIMSFMGDSVRNPVSSWLRNQDTRVLQRLLLNENKLDAGEVDRIISRIQLLSSRRSPPPRARRAA